MSEPREVDMPVVRVTVFEDRAAIERATRVDLPAGAHSLVVRGLPAALSDAHLAARVEPGGAGGDARVEDVRVERRWETDAAAGAERVRELIAEARRAVRALAGAERATERALERREAAATLLERYLGQLGRAVWAADGRPATWATHVVRLEEGFDATERAVAQARETRRARAEEHQRVADRLRDGEHREQRLVADVTVRLSAIASGPVRLVISTIMPCAVWRPAHEAHLLADGRVRWTTFATVWQRTGEPWSGVDLRLSTARPSAGAELPDLSEDRLVLQERASRKQIVLAHRDEAIRADDDDDQGAAPGVYDGGEPRELCPDGPVSVLSDGRPHRVAVGGFECRAELALTATPELAERVWLGAKLRNAGAQPLLAGPVTLLRDGGYVGVGDVEYVGPGELFELSFGSDDQFVVRFRRERRDETRTLARDRRHFVSRAEITSTAPDPSTVEVALRLPVSEIKTLKVVPSETWCSDGLPTPDADGLVRLPVRLAPGERREVKVGFHFDAAADLVVPDPW